MSAFPPRLYAIVDSDVAREHEWQALQLARAYLDGGARLVQLRAKHLSSGALLELAEDLIESGREVGASIIVNDRADVAALARAAGVHVGQQDLSPEQARRVVGARAIVGVSIHTPAQCARAALAPVDYIAVGPVFDTRSKATGYAPLGIEAVAKFCAHTTRPVVAIGGITLDRVGDLLAVGVQSVAVLSDLLTGGEPQARVSEYIAALEGAAG